MTMASSLGGFLKNVSKLAISTAFLGGAFAFPVQAQENGNAESDEGLSNVILVTAQKRAQDISEVTTAVSAVGGEELIARDVIDFQRSPIGCAKRHDHGRRC